VGKEAGSNRWWRRWQLKPRMEVQSRCQRWVTDEGESGTNEPRTKTRWTGDVRGRAASEVKVRVTYLQAELRWVECGGGG
jgi:hypothetical protein